MWALLLKVGPNIVGMLVGGVDTGLVGSQVLSRLVASWPAGRCGQVLGQLAARPRESQDSCQLTDGLVSPQH